MLRSDELKLEITAKRKEIENFQRDQEITKAKNVAIELNKLVDELDIALAKERADDERFFQHKTPAFNLTGADAKTHRNRALDKLLRGKMESLTNEERQAFFNVTGSPGQPGQIESIDSKGGFLVPQEQMRMLLELRQAYVALKDYVSVLSTGTTSGKFPVLPVHNLQLQNFTELTTIPEGDINFTEVNYTIEDYGLTIPVSKQLVDDAAFDIISVTFRTLAQATVFKENIKILNKLTNLVTKTENNALTLNVTPITTHKAFNKALLKDLDGVYYNQAKIYTNQDGILYLADLDDGQNRPLLTPDITQPSRLTYRGKEIIVVPNSTVPNIEISSKSYAPFFVGDMKAYMTFFERQGLEIAVSYERYFETYGVAIRGVARGGVAVTDPNAMLGLVVEL